MVSSMSVWTMLHNHLYLRKVSALWVPHNLMGPQRPAHTEWCREMLHRFQSGDSGILTGVVTSNEILTKHHGPNTRRWTRDHGCYAKMKMKVQWLHNSTPWFACLQSPRECRRGVQYLAWRESWHTMTMCRPTLPAWHQHPWGHSDKAGWPPATRSRPRIVHLLSVPRLWKSTCADCDFQASQCTECVRDWFRLMGSCAQSVAWS